MGSSDRWSASVAPHGHTVRVKERTRGGNVYLVSWNGDRGTHEKTNLKFKVRDADGDLMEDAVERAKEAAAEASNALIRGETLHEETVHMGEVLDLFRREELADMSGRHHDEVERDLELFEEYFGRGFEVATLGPGSGSPSGATGRAAGSTPTGTPSRGRRTGPSGARGRCRRR